MSASLAELRLAVEAFASRFDARLLSATDAARVLADLTAMRNMISTAESLAAARVAACGTWKRAGAGSKSSPRWRTRLDVVRCLLNRPQR